MEHLPPHLPTEAAAALSRVCPKEFYRYESVDGAFNLNEKKKFDNYVNTYEEHFKNRYEIFEQWGNEICIDYHGGINKTSWKAPTPKRPNSAKILKAFKALKEANNIDENKAKVCMVLPCNPDFPEC